MHVMGAACGALFFLVGNSATRGVQNTAGAFGDLAHLAEQ